MFIVRRKVIKRQEKDTKYEKRNASGKIQNLYYWGIKTDPGHISSPRYQTQQHDQTNKTVFTDIYVIQLFQQAYDEGNVLAQIEVSTIQKKKKKQIEVSTM